MSNENNNPTWRERLKELKGIVVIPTYNNASTLARVVSGVREYAEAVLVVDDGSTDNTRQVLKAFPEVWVMRHTENQGKGAALKDGLGAAKAAGFRYAITIDADGQHYASDIPRFIERIEQEPGALLVGARNIRSENMPGKNTFANRFSNFWFTLETGLELADTQSGYRAYPLYRMDVQRWWYTAKYEFELEAIVFAAWGGIAVRNIPVQVYYPPREERVSHFRPFRDFTRISILNTLLVLVCLCWIWPRNFFRWCRWKNIRSFLDRQVLHAPDSNRALSASVMLGVFMGIVPVWGYQMILTLGLSHLLKLNKVIALIASNISIPPLLPFVLYGSYYTGCRVLGRPCTLLYHEVSFDTLRRVLEQYVVGSILFALLCSVAAGALSFVLLTLFRKQKGASA